VGALVETTALAALGEGVFLRVYLHRHGHSLTPWLLLAATCGVVCGWALLAHPGIAPVVAFIFPFYAALGAGLYSLAQALRRGGEEEDGLEGEDGPGEDPPEPPWWPEFEEQLRSYSRRQRESEPLSSHR